MNRHFCFANDFYASITVLLQLVNDPYNLTLQTLGLNNFRSLLIFFLNSLLLYLYSSYTCMYAYGFKQ